MHYALWIMNYNGNHNYELWIMNSELMLEFNLQTCLKNRECVVVECSVICCASDRTTNTPNHILIKVVVEGQ